MGCAELHEAVGPGTDLVLKYSFIFLCGQSNKLAIRSDGVGEDTDRKIF